MTTDLARFESLDRGAAGATRDRGQQCAAFLEDLAEAVRVQWSRQYVGITERSYFRDGPGLGGAALQRYRFESPAVRTSFLVASESGRARTWRFSR